MTLESKDIQRYIPHRYPFLLVDRITELEPGKRAVGIKNVTRNEPFFEGHFPDLPIMPGVLMIEALAQVGAVAMMAQPGFEGKLGLFAGIDTARFRRTVIPGDTLKMEFVVTRLRGTIAKGEAKAWVGDEMAVEAELLFAVVDRQSVEGNNA